MSVPYLDTSALAKWYLNEPGSDDFEAFITRHEAAEISRLTIVEFRCALARRRRAGELPREIEETAFRLFQSDILQGCLAVHPIQDHQMQTALVLLDRLRTHPLGTLDALHLTIAMDVGTSVLATADRVMARAAKSLGLEVATFG